MSKEQVMDYVMNSPANTNPNVLSGMLDSVAQGGGTVEPYTVRVNPTSGADCELWVQDVTKHDLISVDEIIAMLKSGRNVGFVIISGTYGGTFGTFLLNGITSLTSGFALHMRQNGETTASLTALYLWFPYGSTTTGRLVAHEVA